MAIVSDISHVDEIIERLEELEKYQVVVGVTSSAGGEILMIANVHEYGCNIPVTTKMRGFFLYNWGIMLTKSTINIPERSFVRAGFDAKKGEIESYGDLIESVVTGGLSGREFFEIIGQAAAQAIQSFLITDVKSPPNSSFTIMNKGGKSNPLVDSGRLVNSISYEIRGK